MITFTGSVERDVLDKYGDVSGTAKHDVKGCIEWPDSTSSAPGPAVTTTTTRTLLAPFGADILDGDIVTLPGRLRWRVVGDPFSWANPLTGRRLGVQVPLERAK